jgi:hypothetical protein
MRIKHEVAVRVGSITGFCPVSITVYNETGHRLQSRVVILWYPRRDYAHVFDLSHYSSFHLNEAAAIAIQRRRAGVRPEAQAVRGPAIGQRAVARGLNRQARY